MAPFSYIPHAEYIGEILKKSTSLIRVPLRCQIDSVLTVLDCLVEVFPLPCFFILRTEINTAIMKPTSPIGL